MYSDQELVDIKSKFIGQRVQINVGSDRDVIGELQGLFYNEMYPEWNLCCFVNSFCYKNIDVKNIKIV